MPARPPDPDHSPKPVAERGPNEPKKVVAFGDLAGDGNAVVIEYGGQQYLLRRTKSGKLVLTK